MLSWGELFDKIKQDTRLESAKAEFIRSAYEASAKQIVRRVYKLEDVGKYRTFRDGRLEETDPENRELFALAMSDLPQGIPSLTDELPLLAAAFRLTGDDVLGKRVLDQLSEMSNWSPLQRPGWTLYAPGHQLPPDGRDGNWLATGLGVRTIVDTLELMPEGTVDSSLCARLEVLLIREIAGIVDDWETQRPWFVKADNPCTNQWILPTEGLIRASIVVGVEKHRRAYELGVRNMLRAFESHGREGEFVEGIHYAGFSVSSMVHTAYAMAVRGDRRLLEHSFLRRFPLWMIHHFQPGRMMINCFDAFNAARGDYKPFARLLSLLAVCIRSPVARWALTHFIESPADNIAGLSFHVLSDAYMDRDPPLYAVYDRARRVNWRSSWNNDATGIWVRGGHEHDQHDHQDRGHVNFVLHGQPVFIEAGTPAYHNRRIKSHYSSCRGHNVLQIGATFNTLSEGHVDVPLRVRGWQLPNCLAPITVRKLDSDGGDIRVDGTKGYNEVKYWYRDVKWSRDFLEVRDTVKPAQDVCEQILFRWHLGTTEEVSIQGEGKRFSVSWDGIEITLEGSCRLHVSQEKMPDHTLVPREWEDASPDHLHICLSVRTKKFASEFNLVTQVKKSEKNA